MKDIMLIIDNAVSEAVGSAVRYASYTTSNKAASPSGHPAWRLPAFAICAVGVGLGASSTFCSSPKERSFIMVKPDGVNRGLCGDILARFERKGYKLVGAKVLVPSRQLATQHYAEHHGKPFFEKLCGFLTSGPVLALVFEGKGAISYGRTLIGATNPLNSPPGTIRGDFGIDVGRNIIHGSDSPESAQREIALWFSPEELTEYDRQVDAWIYEG